MTPGSCLPVLVLVLLAAPAAPAQEPPASASVLAAAPAGAPTRLGQQVVARSAVVAVVSVDAVDAAAFGVELARVRVLEPLLTGPIGTARPGATVAVVAYPGALVTGERALLFLEAMPSGDRFAVVHRVRQRDEHFERKLETARSTVALAGIEDASTRARATTEWLLAGLASRDPWRVNYALGELRWVAARQSWALPPGTAARLREQARRMADRALAAGVENVAKGLEDRARRLPAPPDKAPSSP